MKKKLLWSQIILGILGLLYLIILFVPLGLTSVNRIPLILFTGILLCVSIYFACYLGARELEKKHKKSDSVYGIMFGAGIMVGMVIEGMNKYI
jgi:hypothetical protein